MKSTIYKSYAAIVSAMIVAVSLLFMNSKSDAYEWKIEDQKSLVVCLQMAVIFSIAFLVYLSFICVIEKLSCVCYLESKSLSNIVKKFTARSWHIIIPMITAGLFAGMIVVFYFEASWNLRSAVIGIFLIASCLLSQEPTSVEISTMWEDNNINVGFGLAAQFFYGYIKVLMSSDHDWEHRIQRYSSEQGVRIFSKLIFLLPRSCKVRNTLTEVDRRLIYAQSLHPKIKMLSGLRREFRNTVWKIDEGIRFVAEYPPPLSTLQDMCYTGTGHHLSDDAKREQLKIFTHRLQNLIKNDPYCCNNCLLIPYNESKPEVYTVRDENSSNRIIRILWRGSENSWLIRQWWSYDA